MHCHSDVATVDRTELFECNVIIMSFSMHLVQRIELFLGFLLSNSRHAHHQNLHRNSLNFYFVCLLC